MSSVGRALCEQYECGKILNEQAFEEVLTDVLSSSEKI